MSQSSNHSNEPQFDWVAGFRYQMKQVSLNLKREEYYKLLKKFESIVSVEVSKLRSKPNRATKFCHVMKSFISNFKLMEFAGQFGLESYEEILPALGLILTHFINLVQSSSMKDRKPASDIANSLYSFVKVILEGSSEYVLDTVLSSTVVEDSTEPNSIAFQLLKKILQEKELYNGDSETFFKYLAILKLAQDCEFEEADKKIRKILLQVKYPIDFPEYLKTKLKFKSDDNFDDLDLTQTLTKIKPLRVVKDAKLRLTVKQLDAPQSDPESDEFTLKDSESLFFIDLGGYRQESLMDPGPLDAYKGVYNDDDDKKAHLSDAGENGIDEIVLDSDNSNVDSEEELPLSEPESDEDNLEGKERTTESESDEGVEVVEEKSKDDPTISMSESDGEFNDSSPQDDPVVDEVGSDSEEVNNENPKEDLKKSEVLCDENVGGEAELLVQASPEDVLVESDIEEDNISLDLPVRDVNSDDEESADSDATIQLSKSDIKTSPVLGDSPKIKNTLVTRSDSPTERQTTPSPNLTTIRKTLATNSRSQTRTVTTRNRTSAISSVLSKISVEMQALNFSTTAPKTRSARSSLPTGRKTSPAATPPKSRAINKTLEISSPSHPRTTRNRTATTALSPSTTSSERKALSSPTGTEAETETPAANSVLPNKKNTTPVPKSPATTIILPPTSSVSTRTITTRNRTVPMSPINPKSSVQNVHPSTPSSPAGTKTIVRVSVAINNAAIRSLAEKKTTAKSKKTGATSVSQSQKISIPEQPIAMRTRTRGKRTLSPTTQLSKTKNSRTIQPGPSKKTKL